MSSIAEKRVYADATGPTVAVVACAAGVAAVSVADDRIGEFGLVHRGDVRDVAAVNGGATDGERATVGDGATGVAVATADDVLIAAGPPDGTDLDFRPTGFGSAVAVSGDGAGGADASGADRSVVAAGPDGRVARRDPDGAWTTLGTLPEVAALDGGLVAADGVYRVADDGLVSVALAGAAVRDVTAALPHAATGDGLYRLSAGPGGEDSEGDPDAERVLDGAFRTVASATGGAGDRGEGDGRRPRAHAATAEALYAREIGGGEQGDGDAAWRATDLPAASPIAGVAYGTATYAVTADGTFLADAGEGWRSRVLGLPDARAIAVAGRASGADE